MKNDYIKNSDGTVDILLFSSVTGETLFTKVTAEGFEIANAFPGTFRPYKHPRSGKYYARGLYMYWDNGVEKRTEPMLHRLIMKPGRGQNTAHIDGNTLNNTRGNMVNLRIGMTVQDYLADQPKPDASQEILPLKGVSLHKHKNKWEVSPFYNGQRYRLGYWNHDQLQEANTAVTEFRDLGPEAYFNKHPKKER